jgi:hypothetical protein
MFYEHRFTHSIHGRVGVYEGTERLGSHRRPIAIRIDGGCFEADEEMRDHAPSAKRS